MNLVDLILLACTLANPGSCREYPHPVPVRGLVAKLHDAGAALSGAMGGRTSGVPGGAVALRLAGSRRWEDLKIGVRH